LAAQKPYPFAALGLAMDTARTGDVIYGTFSEGVDLREAYHELMRERGIEAGVVLSGIGMVQDPTLGFFEGDGVYDEQTLEGRFELLATQGNLATDDGEPFAHLHVTLAGEDHGSIGGHFFGGQVHVGHEFGVRVLPAGSLVREHDPSTGLKGLELP
jgi:predicted DNA-binding protein with PD1-like motif